MAAFTLALALTLSAPAAQDFTDIEKDARCTIALQSVSEKATDPGAKAALEGLMMFYVGRLSVRVSAGQMESTINAAGTTLKESEYREVARQCTEGVRTLTGAK